MKTDKWLSFRVDPELRERTKKQAKSEGNRTIDSLIRQALEEYLKKKP